MMPTVGILVESAPKRQRCFRVMHILFGINGGNELNPDVLRQFLAAAVQCLKNGLNVYGIHEFRRFCGAHKDWPMSDYMISEEDEAAVGARAEAAIQAALSGAERPCAVECADGFSTSHRLVQKRSRLDATELSELLDQMRAAEVYADVHDHQAMDKAVKRLLSLIPTLQQSMVNLSTMDLIFLQLEIVRRCVELCLSVGDVKTFQDLAGSTTEALMAQASECVSHVLGCSSSYLTQQQRTAEDTFSELEEYVVFFSVIRALCMFEDKNFAEFARAFVGNGLRGATYFPSVEELLTKRRDLKATASLEGRINATAAFHPIHGLRTLVETSISSGPQLGVMLLFSAFATLPHTEAMELVTRVDIMPLWENVPDAHLLVESFQLAKWKEFICAASALTSSFLKTDILAYKHSEHLYSLVVSHAVSIYANAFGRLDLNKAAARFSIPLWQLKEIVHALILNGPLEAKMDLISCLLTSSKFKKDLENCSPEFLVVLDCIHRCDRSFADSEQSLRILSLRNNSIR